MKPARRESKQIGYTPQPRAPAVGSGLVRAAFALHERTPRTPALLLPSNAALESEHLGRVKRLRCVLCVVLALRQESHTDAHHLRIGQGAAQRASDWITAALCHYRCHQGTHGVHGDRSLLRQAKCTEIDLLALTLAALARGEA